MLQTKVKISKVNNLTDARYFAAMGADFLGFCCNTGTEMYCSPQRIKEISQWVEGPQFVLEFDGWQQESDIKSLLATISGQSVHFGAFATYSGDFGVPVFKDYILENIEDADFKGIDFPVVRSEKYFTQLSEKEINNLNTLSKSKNFFLDIGFESEELAEILDKIPVYGIILRGGEEEKVGVKSFEKLDKIFDFLK